MGYSRENKRQNDALQSILDGGTPEKRIFVAMEDVNEKKENSELKFNLWYWIQDNSFDFLSAFIASFITLRFLGFMDSFLSFNVGGMELDVMLYGLILGITYQYTFRKLLKFATGD